MGMDSASPGYQRTTCIWPHESQKCAYKAFTLYYVPEVVNTSLHVHFVVVVTRYEKIQWRAAKPAKRSLHDAVKRGGKTAVEEQKCHGGLMNCKKRYCLHTG